DGRVARQIGSDRRGPRALTLRRRGDAVAALAVAVDAVRGAGARQILADLADGVVHPPDVGEVRALAPEAVLIERRHHGRAGRAAAVLSELEEAAERRRRHAAEEVVLDRGWRAERLVRDAGRDPGEEVLHREPRRVAAGDA